MSVSKKIKILLAMSNISEAKLARLIEESPQNFNKKMRRDNFSERDLKKIAEALNCEYEIKFITNDTKEII